MVYEKPMAEIVRLQTSEQMMLEYGESVGDWDDEEEVEDW